MSTTNQIRELKAHWALLFPKIAAPDNSQWALWLLRHDAAVVRRGIAELGIKYRKLQGAMDAAWVLKFASSVMNRISSEQSHKAPGAA